MPTTVTDRIAGLTTSVAVKAPVQAITTANIALSTLTPGNVQLGAYTAALAEDTRILVLAQTDATENGIYYASTGDWTRTEDFDGNRDAVNGSVVIFAASPSLNVLYQLACSDNPIVIGTSLLVFTLMSSPIGPYPITAAELANSVVPTNLGYPPDPNYTYRDGATVNGVANDSPAVALAIQSTQPIYFPMGTSQLTDAVPGFHAAQKYGPGLVTRGGYFFTITPRTGDVNVIYVDPSGSDTTNDGLSPDKPLQTIQTACTALAYYGCSLGGTWKIQGAAGTYGGLITFPENVRGLNRVVLQGPIVGHPNVPTMIIDGSGAQAYAFNNNGNNKMLISDVKAQNFTTYGFVSQDLCDIRFVNVHTANIAGGAGIKMQQGRLRVEGGIHTANQWGIEAISGVTVSVGTGAASLTDGTQFQNCTQGGLFLQERVSGDVFYATANNCAVGFDLTTVGRVRGVGCSLTNNATAGVRLQALSGWYQDAVVPCVFSGNLQDVQGGAFAYEAGRQGQYVSELCPASDITAVSHTGDTLEFTLKTYSSAIAKNLFSWLGKKLRIDISGVLTGNAGTKTLRMYLAGGTLASTQIASFVIPATYVGAFVMEGKLMAKTGVVQSFKGKVFVDSTAATTAPLVSVQSLALAMLAGADLTLTITCQNAAAGDTFQINTVERPETG